MKKALLFAIVGAVVIFIWQFISFAMPNLHKAGMEYTPIQDEILSAIEKSGLKEGMYMLGQPDPDLSREDYEAAMEKYEGKPWAVINYQEVNSSAMAMNMVRGFIIAFLISLIFFWLLTQQKDPTVWKRIILGISIGFIGFLFVPYTNFIWFREPDIWAYMLDGIAPWAILGWIGHKIA